VLFQLQNFLALVLGFFIGQIFAIIPGLTATHAIVLLLPMPYSMQMNTALCMCMGIYMAGMYGGSITAITINIPGAPSSCMTGLEGYPLMRQGKGAMAIGHASFASAIGGTIGVLLLILISPIAVKAALLVKTPGKASLVLFAFIVICAMQGKGWKKALVMTIIGMVSSTIGMGVLSPTARFTFGSVVLMEGIEFIPVVIGSFAISEVLTQSEMLNREYQKVSDSVKDMKINRKDFLPRWSDLKEIGIVTYIKSSLIGFFIGVLPGAGGSLASFVSYAEAQRSSKHPERFGSGALVGIAASESSNNAVCGGAMVPMLAFGIPGDGVTAVVLGVLMVYGIVPGPDILTRQMHLVTPMYAALLIAACVLIPVSLMLFGPYYIKIVRINRIVLYSSIALIAIIGAYAATSSIFQIVVAVVIGIIVYFMRKEKYPAVTLILGALLGPMFEGYFRRSLSISKNNLAIFLEPDSLAFLLLTVFFVLFLTKFNKKEKPC
jgi:putative tricarboxylic transport membrane protein